VALLDGTTVFSTRTKLVNDFFAFPADAATLRNGAFVAIGDLNGDGYSDLIFGGVPHVFAIGGQTLIGGTIQDAFNNPLANFFVNGNASDRGGVRVATTDADQDSNADLVTGSGENARRECGSISGRTSRPRVNRPHPPTCRSSAATRYPPA
jgi:hypothetical protein